MSRSTQRATILDDLAARGLIHDSTDRAELQALLESGSVTLYYGCDPTSDSLHAGNLIGLLILRRFQLAGHKPIALAGGATGMIGDPSGRSDERTLLDEGTLARNIEGISEQLRRFIDFEPGPAQAELVNNATWTTPVSLIAFLRDVGKHFTINQMVAKESVRSRMDSDTGISFTEFSYMLLQAFDFAWLNEHKGCLLQIGGSDQWGNITAGIDLIRRRWAVSAHGLTWPLMTKADGTKFGKSMGGNVWLSAARTSPYAFYQYWIQCDDRDVDRFLLQLTLLPLDEVRAIVDEHTSAPEKRSAQRRLAAEITGLVHGGAALAAAEEATAVVFGSSEAPSAAALESLIDEVPTTRIPATRLREGVSVVELLVEAGIVDSKGAARRLLSQSGVTIGGARPDPAANVGAGELQHGRFLLLRRGKRSVHLVVTA